MHKPRRTCRGGDTGEGYCKDNRANSVTWVTEPVISADGWFSAHGNTTGGRVSQSASLAPFNFNNVLDVDINPATGNRRERSA